MKESDTEVGQDPTTDQGRNAEALKEKEILQNDIQVDPEGTVQDQEKSTDVKVDQEAEEIEDN